MLRKAAISRTLIFLAFLLPLKATAIGRTFAEVHSENIRNSRIVGDLSQVPLSAQFKNRTLNILKNAADKRYYSQRLANWKIPSGFQLVPYLDEIHLLRENRRVLRLSRDKNSQGIWINERLFSWNPEKSLRSEMKRFFAQGKKTADRTKSVNLLLLFAEDAVADTSPASLEAEVTSDVAAFYVLGDRNSPAPGATLPQVRNPYFYGTSLTNHLKTALGPQPGGMTEAVSKNLPESFRDSLLLRPITCRDHQASGEIFFRGSNEPVSFRAEQDGTTVLSTGKDNAKKFYRVSPQPVELTAYVNSKEDPKVEFDRIRSKLDAILSEKSPDPKKALDTLSKLYESIGSISCNTPTKNLPLYNQVSLGNPRCLPKADETKKQLTVEEGGYSNTIDMCKANWWILGLPVRYDEASRPRATIPLPGAKFLFGAERAKLGEQVSPIKRFLSYCEEAKKKTAKDIAAELKADLEYVKTNFEKSRVYDLTSDRFFAQSCIDVDCKNSSIPSAILPNQFISDLQIPQDDGIRETAETISALSMLAACCDDKSCVDLLKKDGVPLEDASSQKAD